MGRFPQSFEVYGFTIEVLAGGRRVWPPSFNRFVKDKLDSGELAVSDVTKTCNVSQSLVYKWRSDVRRAGTKRTSRREERLFSEIVIEDGPCSKPADHGNDQITIHFSGCVDA
jgi:transposase-like protein